MTNASQLLDVRDLTVEYDVGRRRPRLRAVDGVSLSIAPGETVGLVGESGSGKTTIGRAILGLAPIHSGNVSFAGSNITNASFRERRALSRDLQVVFQDPYSSLNPTRTVAQTLGETVRVHEKLAKDEVAFRVRTMLERFGLPGDAERRYPSQFSGGQRQRIAIARALMLQPRLVICDEPVSALDLSVQAQVLNLLRNLQRELHLSYLFIAHDLAVVRHLSHRIIVLYRGRVMEQGGAHLVYSQPLHPYTRALLDAAPTPDPEMQRLRRASRPASLRDESSPGRDGCPFADRCPYVVDRCLSERPLLETAPTGVSVACHRWRDLQDAEVMGVRNLGEQPSARGIA